MKEPELEGNALLALAPAARAARLHRALEPVVLRRGEVLAVAGEAQQHVYFPAGCLVSVSVPLRNGRGVHVGLVGSEGFIGLPVLLDTEPGAHRLVCQIGGRAMRMSSDAFRKMVRRGDGLRRVLLQYAGVRLSEETQHLACAAVHAVSPRLASWLLFTRDRAGSSNLPLTQEVLAEMLAVRRPYLSRLMQDLQRRGHIQYRRGWVRILSASGLGAMACEDYAEVCAMYRRVFHPAAA